MTQLETETIKLLRDIFFEGYLKLHHLETWVDILKYAVEEDLLEPDLLETAKSQREDYK